MSDDNKLRDAADAVRGVVEAVPVYQDALQPAVRELGKGLEGVVRVALAPVSALVWGYDRIAEWLPRAIADRLNDVPSERITTPPPELACPTLESLRYTAQREELREMFANLLATSMDTATAHQAHPSFVEVIRQLTPDEAKVVRLFGAQSRYPIVTLELRLKTGGSVPALRNFTTLTDDAVCSRPQPSGAYIDNLTRLGLIAVHYGVRLTDDTLYEPLLQHPIMVGLQKQIALDAQYADREQVHERGIIDTTEFGRLFFRACIRPEPRSA